MVQVEVQVQGNSGLSPISFAGMLKTEQREFILQKLIALIARVFEVHPSTITTRTRKRQVVDARHACVWFMANHYKMDYPTISETIGIHRTSVYDNLTKVDNLIETDPDFASKISLIKTTIGHE